MDDDYLSMDIATKYYQLARRSAATPEQKARCTFMLAKCALNDIYNLPDYDKIMPAMLVNKQAADAAYRRYNDCFETLKVSYSHTAYYREVLKECGYFKDYVHPPGRRKKRNK